LEQGATTQLGLFPQASRGRILVSDKTMEFLKDRLDKQIRELTRENGHLRDTVFRKDCELNAVRLQLADADKTHTFLSVTLGITLLLLFVFSLYAVRLVGG
jgi:hypothetical protein